MIIIIYSDTTACTIESNLGQPEYSYYFVLKEFRPVLEQLGIVVTVSDPRHEVDPIYRSALAHGESCVFLSFSPPHKTEVGLACPTIPVFAWEFDTIPDEVWFEDPRNDWRFVFGKLGCAITHSQFTVNAVKGVTGPDFPIVSLPAPVWDRFARHYSALTDVADNETEIEVAGTVLDLRQMDLAPYSPTLRHQAKPLLGRTPEAARRDPARIRLGGVVYLSVFNPHDGRKNWFDMICAFCWNFRDTPDVTLVLKLTHSHAEEALNALLENFYKLTPYSCRVVIVHGFLSDPEYEKLVSVTTYVVNTSHGEGQCLPLMEFMSSGKPALAPRHTAMLDYIDGDNAFLIEADREPTHWPHDPRVASRAMRYRINWESLLQAYQDSYEVAKHDPARYAQMAHRAVQSLREYCSRQVMKQRLVAFLERHPVLQRDRAANAPRVVEQHRTHVDVE